MSKIHKLNWPRMIYKLQYDHSIIYTSPLNGRNLRHSQRLMRKSFHHKVLFIYIILSNSGLEPICTCKLKQIQYIRYIHELNTIQINWTLLSDAKYRLFLRQQINDILSILCYFAVFEKINHLSMIGSSQENRLNPHNQSLLTLLIHKLHRHQWFCFMHFQLELKQLLKYWLIKPFLMESKIIIFWFFKLHDCHTHPFLQLKTPMTISISDYIKVLYIYYIIRLLKIEIFNSVYYIDTLIVVHSHASVLKQYHSALDKGMHLHVQYYTSYNICRGFTWFGWFIQYKYNNIHKNISRDNIRAHQMELIQLLKRSGIYTLDKVILLLNKKIRLWKSFYLRQSKNSKLELYLNKYLFWRVWYFLKKRFKNKGSKWVIQCYFKWNRSTKKWTLISNNITLISYHCLHL